MTPLGRAAEQNAVSCLSSKNFCLPPLECITLSYWGEPHICLLLSSLLWGGGELGPGNPLCTTPAAFSLALSCSWPRRALGAGGSRVWAGWTGRPLSCQHPAYVPTQPRPSSRPQMGMWASIPRILPFHINPHFLAQTHLLHLPFRLLIRG